MMPSFHFGDLDDNVLDLLIYNPYSFADTVYTNHEAGIAT